MTLTVAITFVPLKLVASSIKAKNELSSLQLWTKKRIAWVKGCALDCHRFYKSTVVYCLHQTEYEYML